MEGGSGAVGGAAVGDVCGGEEVDLGLGEGVGFEMAPADGVGWVGAEGKEGREGD